jgi:hypothetical protein
VETGVKRYFIPYTDSYTRVIKDALKCPCEVELKWKKKRSKTPLIVHLKTQLVPYY